MEATPFEAAAVHIAAVAHSGLPASATRWRETTDQAEQLDLEDIDRLATDILGRWAVVVDEALDIEPIEPADSIAELARAARAAEVALTEALPDDDEWDPEATKYVVVVRQYADRLNRYGRPA